jgi:hypothetical protein
MKKTTRTNLNGFSKTRELGEKSGGSLSRQFLKDMARMLHAVDLTCHHGDLVKDPTGAKVAGH